MYKKIGNTFYIHKSNIKELDSVLEGGICKLIETISKSLPVNFDYEIIKFDKKNEKISFIESPDWNSAREPLVGDSYTTNISDIKFKLIKSKGQIYHHKWMFVSEDYTGFNIEEAKEWSKAWSETLPNTREIKSRIGYKKYWDEILKQYNLPIS